eukprot:CAMPEP_0116895080 /NCGR_PEP_ID=MMETSP0467-20121206/4691_1 /TAXON_ID=283647 /ORGANISM="Mesodinium pulex, Strain SPMC105" /LENGTH=69 /DNA_ID=CAMNT_0004565627 /DNA_START=1658 /DNA_END=1870 /DNA_ORIENTATION=-
MWAYRLWSATTKELLQDKQQDGSGSGTKSPESKGKGKGKEALDQLVDSLRVDWNVDAHLTNKHSMFNHL